MILIFKNKKTIQMKKIFMLFALMGALTFGAQAQKTCAKKCTKPCDKSAKMVIAPVDDAVIAKAASLDANIERRACAKSGSVAYFKKSTCVKSGNVSFTEVNYDANSNTFVNKSPSKMANQKAMGAAPAAVSNSGNVGGAIQVTDKTDGKAKASCSNGTAGKACCAKGKGVAKKASMTNAKTGKACCSKDAAKACKGKAKVTKQATLEMAPATSGSEGQ